MKKNFSARTLRIENLENRAMLSAAPFDAAAAANVAAEVASVETADAVINVRGVESSDAVTFEATDAARVYTMSWDAAEDAASYNVKISRDGGETFITYAKPTDAEATVSGLWAGRVYQFKIYGANENGKLVGDPIEATFAPIDLASDANVYAPGQPISVVLKGADEATATIKWFSVTDDGETEIAEAENCLEYVPENGDAEIRVVATGTGVSEGSVAELTFAPIEIFDVDYDATAHVATLNWDPVDDATAYRVRISRDGGETFVTYAKNLTEPSAEIRGVYPGKSYEFKVIASNDDTLNLDEAYSLFAPVRVSVNKKEFNDGDAIVAKVWGSEDASATLQWYSSPDGEEWTAIDGANQTTFVVGEEFADDAFVKVVATGTLYSTGSVSEMVVPRAVQVPETPGTIVGTLDDVVDEWDGVISLREAITLYAGTGDTITFDESLAGATIVLNAENGGFVIDSSCAIEGAGVTLDASAIESSVFKVSGANTSFKLSDMTIENSSVAGETAYGAAIYAYNADEVVLDSVTFSNNSVASTRTNYTANAGGGAVILNGTDAVIRNSVFDGNSVVNGTVGGGAISVATGSDVTIENSVFTNNSAGYTGTTSWATGGGAIAMTGYDNSLTIVNSTFTGNTTSNATAAGSNGGAIRVYSNVVNQPTYPVVEISGSTFDANQNAIALVGYAGNNSTSATISIADSTFTNDTNAAIFNVSGSSTNCTIDVTGGSVKNNAIGVANAAAGQITVTGVDVENNGVDFRNTGTGEIVVSNSSEALVDEAFADFFEEIFE